MSTIRQDEKFGGRFLEDIVEWIGVEFDVDDVFSRGDMIDFIKDSCHVGDVFEDDEIRAYVEKNFAPEQIFPYGRLKEWAESMGFRELVD